MRGCGEAGRLLPVVLAGRYYRLMEAPAQGQTFSPVPREGLKLASLKNEVNLFCFLGADGYFLFGLAVFFVPGFEGVIAGGQIVQVESAVLAGDLEVGVLEYGDIALHPAVDVALDRHGDLFAGVLTQRQRLDSALKTLR